MAVLGAYAWFGSCAMLVSACADAPGKESAGKDMDDVVAAEAELGMELALVCEELLKLGLFQTQDELSRYAVRPPPYTCLSLSLSLSPNNGPRAR